jgi:hypothetical protein
MSPTTAAKTALDDDPREPESQLGMLNKSLLNLLGALTIIDAKEDGLISDTRTILRHTLTAELLNARHMVAVAGTQGTGKTTLVRNLYDLDSDWMLSSWGQGERMPVFILEDAKATAPQGRITRLVNDEKTGKRWHTENVDPARWREALRTDDGDVFLMELVVPVRFFPDAPRRSAGLLLLPGFEPRDEDNRLWQELMRQALVGSSRVLLVTHEQDIAADTADEALAELQQQYLQGTYPLVAITHCDAIVEDAGTRELLGKTAADRMRVPARNVFCTWSAATAPLELGGLSQAIGALTDQHGISRAVQLRQLERVLRKDLGKLLTAAAAALEARANSGQVGQGREVRQLMIAFDNAQTDVRTEYDKRVSQELQTIRGEAYRRIEELHLDRDEGWGNLFGRLGNIVKLRRGRNRSKGEKLILDAWLGDDNTVSPLTGVHRTILTDVVQGQFTRKALKVGSAWRTAPGDDEAAGDEVQTIQDPSTAAVFREVHRLTTLDQGMNGRPERGFETAMAILPALILEWAHVGSLFPEFVGLRPDTLEADLGGNMQSDLAEFTEAMKRWDATQREMIAAWASLAGLGAGATRIETVQALFLAARGGAGGAVARSVASVVAGGAVAGAAVAVLTVNMLNRQSGARRSAAEAAIDAIYNQELSMRLEAFDSLMELAREMLSTRLRRAYELDADAAAEEWLRWNLRTATARRRDLIETLNGRLDGLG